MIPVGSASAGDGGAALGEAFESSVTAMAVLDREGRFTAVNPALCRLLGRDEAELLGHRTAEFTHPDDRYLSASTVRSLAEGRAEADTARKRFVRPDGREVHVLRTVTVLRDSRRRRSGMLTQMVDVTELVETEQALRHSEQRLEALVAQSGELTLLLDADAVITYASPAAEPMLGHPPAEVVGRSAFDFLHPDDLPDATAKLAARLAGGAGSEKPPVYRVHHRDGGWRRAEIRLTNAFDDPAVGAAVVQLRDVTDVHEFREEAAFGAARLERLVGSAWDVITLHGPDGGCHFASPAVTAQLGWDPADVVGAPAFDLVHPDDRGRIAEFFANVTGGHPVDGLQYRMRTVDGDWRWVESSASNRLDDPAVRGIVLVTRDITARRRRAAQQEAVAALSGQAVRGGGLEQLHAQAVEVVATLVDADRAVLYDLASGALEALCSAGPCAEAGAAPPAAATVAVETGHAVVVPLDASADAAVSAAAPIGGDDGDFGVLACECAGRAAFSSDDLSFLEAVANVLAAATRRHRTDDELRRQATSDELTGLPNRHELRARLVAALADGAEVAVLLIDADDFKLVNDTLGHATGDALVSAVATRLVRNLRRSDTVARLGGDEFVVLCPGASAADAARVAERLRIALAAPVDINGRQIAMSVSVGFVVGDASSDPDDLVARADVAMYAAKQAGKNRVAQYDEAMRARAAQRLEVASGLRRAIAQNELLLHFQPVFEVATGRLVGAEALVRWQHPTDGLLGPDRFIGYAEESGLILHVGEWVLDQAFRQAAAWADEGFTGRVAVNVSPHQLADTDFVGTVAGAIERAGVDTANLAIEVTETGLMADITRAAAVLGQLRSMGLAIGMDDFGIGYSSLSYLSSLPFDFVKIDRSFVARFHQERRAAALLETIATLCRSLELPAIAEGVETAEQLATVGELGIGQVQGFLLGRPVPPEQFPTAGFGGQAPATAGFARPHE